MRDLPAGVSEARINFIHEVGVTVCTVVVQEVGVARCNPTDKYDLTQGHRLAFERAVRNFPQHVRSRLWDWFWSQHERPVTAKKEPNETTVHDPATCPACQRNRRAIEAAERRARGLESRKESGYFKSRRRRQGHLVPGTSSEEDDQGDSMKMPF